MSLLGSSRGGSRHFRLRDEIHDLETERIPAPDERILRDRRIGVLECCNPVSETLYGPGSLALCLHVTYLRQIRQAVAALKETYRLHLRAHRAAILVNIQRGGRIVLIPECRPGLVALGRVKGSTLFVITLRRLEVEAL